jgi:thiol:disulfide interchange protein
MEETDWYHDPWVSMQMSGEIAAFALLMFGVFALRVCGESNKK